MKSLITGLLSRKRERLEWSGKSKSVGRRPIAAVTKGSELKWIGKPDSVMARNRSHSDHSSCPLIAQGIERPYPRAMGGPPNPPIWPCSRWGLPCARHHWRAGELLPRLFNLTVRGRGRRYVFCGTFLRSLGAVVNGHPVLRSPDFPPPVGHTGSDRLIHFSSLKV